MKTKIAAAVIVGIQLALPFQLASDAQAELPLTHSRGTAQEFFLSVPLPAKDRLTLVNYVPITIGGEILGGLAAYDDATTARPGDYLELYNNRGALLAVSWIDALGIERLAVDRALVEEADDLQGVFVLLITGHSV